ncbi:MAG: DUF1707 domain-containing protein [Dactylosporangium sp.]|nr:DUF1707 domain-containing protein [Dactylosporangium sp.]
MSDADRERMVERLQVAAGEGRLTLDEFQERVGGVLRCDFSRRSSAPGPGQARAPRPGPGPWGRRRGPPPAPPDGCTKRSRRPEHLVRSSPPSRSAMAPATPL